jgi:hypothetical protein
MRPRRLRLGLMVAIVLTISTSAFAQGSISFTQPAGATNQPTLGFLQLIKGVGCAGIFGVALDSLGRPYTAGFTDGCDFDALFVSGPNYQYFSSFSSGGTVSALAIAVDASGNAYVTGTNQDCCVVPAVRAIPGCHINFPGSTNPTLADFVFLTKLDTNGRVVYSTCVPNALGLAGRGVAVDSAGAAYVTGDGGFVVKIDSTPAVVYSKVLASPSGTTTGNAIAVDSAGNAYVTGTTGPGFPVVNPILATGPGAFLAKLNPGGNALVYSTYLPGGGSGNGVAVDTTGNAYVTGSAAAIKVNSSGSAIVYSTPLGAGVGIALDAHGGVYVTGGSSVVTQLSKSGALVYSMNISSANGQQGTAIAVDSLGTAYPVGITFSIDFPTTDGSRCASNDGVTCLGDSSFIGQVGPYSTASVSPSSVIFPTQLVSTTSAAKKISLFNTGTAQMTVAGLQVSGDFSIQTNFCGKGVKPSTHCDVYVTFTPKAAGTRTGTLSFSDNAASSPQKVTLTGVGTTVSLSPTSLAYATQLINTASLPKTLTLSNKGTTSLSITSISTTGDFAISSKTCGTSLGAGTSCTINVTFKPTAIGTRNGSLSVTHNGGGSPSTATLTGIGTVVLVAPTSLTFAAQTVGTTSPAKAITVTNKGSSILTISSIAKTGDFIIASKTCGTSLAVGASCKVNMAFKPTAKGTRTGSLSISHNGGGSPAKVSLIGTGT